MLIMGILFKTYKGKHQLHLYKEVWKAENKRQLEEILSPFSKTEAAKAKVVPEGKYILIELNAIIIDCKNTLDLKQKFAYLVDLKAKYQQMQEAKK